MFGLLYRNISIDIAASDEGVVEHIAEHGNDKPIAGDVADVESQHIVLYQWHDATTYDEHHEDARCLLGIFAQPFNAEVEDGAPHDRGA